MKRQHILPVVVLIVFAAAIGGTYQFFFKERLQQYEKRRALLEQLKDKVQKLETRFTGAGNRPIKPEVYVQKKEAALQPWSDAINRRAAFFTMPIEYAKVPEGEIPRFFYREEWPKRVEEIRQYILSRGVRMNPTAFDTPAPNTLESKAVTKEEVETWLKRMATGFAALRLIVDAGATEIRHFYIWPEIREGGLLAKQVVGVEMVIPLPRFVRFMDEMYSGDRYFNVEAVRVACSTLRTQWDPPVNVSMLLTQASYIDTSATTLQPKAGGPGGGQAAPTFMMKKPVALKPPPAVTKKSWWQSLWPF